MSWECLIISTGVENRGGGTAATGAAATTTSLSKSEEAFDRDVPDHKQTFRAFRTLLLHAP